MYYVNLPEKKCIDSGVLVKKQFNFSDYEFILSIHMYLFNGVFINILVENGT